MLRAGFDFIELFNVFVGLKQSHRGQWSRLNGQFN